MFSSTNRLERHDQDSLAILLSFSFLGYLNKSEKVGSQENGKKFRGRARQLFASVAVSSTGRNMVLGVLRSKMITTSIPACRI